MKLVLVFIILFTIENIYSAVVTTSLGRLKGKEIVVDKQKIHLFKRVPFVEPPLGLLRFALPQSKKPWEGLWDATEYGPACPTNASITKTLQKWVDEDCLHMNIFTTDHCLKSQDCPVAVYLHGGGLIMDSAVMYDDNYIIDAFVKRDIVFILPAFRLGLFGTLMFQKDTIVTKNLPSYDIIAAMEFIHSHIHHFGGTNKKVTVMGHSGGAQAAIIMAFSKTIDPDQRLFQQVAAMSSLSGFMDTDQALEASWEFIYRANCSLLNGPFLEDDRSTQEIVDCLRKLDAKTILRIQREMEEQMGYTGYIVMDENIFTGNSMADFFSNPPKRRLMIGSVWEEIIDEREIQAQYTRHLVVKFLPFNSPNAVKTKYYQDFKQGNMGFNQSHYSQCIFLSAKSNADAIVESGGEAYLYSYENWRHGGHGDDLSYILGSHVFDLDENEKVLKELYHEYFSNFIKYGRPDKDWEPLEKGKDRYFHIDVNVTSGLRPHMAEGYNRPIMKYWYKTMTAYDNKVTAERKLSMGPKGVQIPFMSTIKTNEETRTLHIPTVIVLALGIAIGLLVANLLKKNSYQKGYEMIPH